MREVIITSTLEGFDQRNHFFEGWSWFKLNNLRLALNRYDFEILQQLGKRVKKVAGAKFYVCLSYRGETSWGCLFAPLS